MKAACRASQPRDCMRPQEQEAQEQGLVTGFKLFPHGGRAAATGIFANRQCQGGEGDE